MGETLRKATSTSDAAATSQAHTFLQDFRAIFTMGMAMREITTGRMPLNARST